jgi:hypothetical protein
LLLLLLGFFFFTKCNSNLAIRSNVGYTCHAAEPAMSITLPGTFQPWSSLKTAYTPGCPVTVCVASMRSGTALWPPGTTCSGGSEAQCSLPSFSQLPHSQYYMGRTVYLSSNYYMSEEYCHPIPSCLSPSSNSPLLCPHVSCTSVWHLSTQFIWRSPLYTVTTQQKELNKTAE